MGAPMRTRRRNAGWQARARPRADSPCRVLARVHEGLALDEVELHVAHREPGAMPVEIGPPDLLQADDLGTVGAKSAGTCAKVCLTKGSGPTGGHLEHYSGQGIKGASLPRYRSAHLAPPASRALDLHLSSPARHD